MFSLKIRIYIEVFTISIVHYPVTYNMLTHSRIFWTRLLALAPFIKRWQHPLLFCSNLKPFILIIWYGSTGIEQKNIMRHASARNNLSCNLVFKNYTHHGYAARDWHVDSPFSSRSCEHGNVGLQKKGTIWSLQLLIYILPCTARRFALNSLLDLDHNPLPVYKNNKMNSLVFILKTQEKRKIDMKCRHAFN